MKSLSISLPEDEQDDPEVLGEGLTANFTNAVLRDHGCTPAEFWDERAEGLHGKPVTLGELRDWLGY